MNVRGLLCDKFKLKLLSLLFAAFLWFFVTMERTDEMELPLAVDFINVPTGMEVRAGSLPKHSVAVSGARILLLRQKFRGAAAHLDLAGATAGRVDFTSMERYVRLESGLRPLRVSPATLTVILENASSTGAK